MLAWNRPSRDAVSTDLDRSRHNVGRTQCPSDCLTQSNTFLKSKLRHASCICPQLSRGHLSGMVQELRNASICRVKYVGFTDQRLNNDECLGTTRPIPDTRERPESPVFHLCVPSMHVHPPVSQNVLHNGGLLLAHLSILAQVRAGSLLVNPPGGQRHKSPAGDRRCTPPIRRWDAPAHHHFAQSTFQGDYRSAARDGPNLDELGTRLWRVSG